MRPYRIACILLAAACGLPPAVRADTEVGGTISTNAKWTASGSPYIVTSTVTVNSGVTLAIEPGVTVRVNPNLYIIVNGTLTAVGTAAKPIVFTANTQSPTPGYWRSLRIESGSGTSSQLEYVTVEYGGYQYFSVYYYGGVTVNQSSPSLDHVTVTNSSKAGVYLLGSGAAPTITNSAFTGNAESGVRMAGATSVTLAASTITGNGGTGVNLEGGATATITDSTITGNGDAGVSVATACEATVADTQITDNTGYALKASADSHLLDLTGLTISGNGGGTKDAVGHQGGTIGGAERWRSAVEWHLTGNLTVGAAGSLTVDPGTTVRVDQGRRILVSGTMTALGTPWQPIAFTANTVSPTPGYWWGIRFEPDSGSSGQLAYVTASYGGRTYFTQYDSFYGVITANGSSPVNRAGFSGDSFS